MRIAVCVAQVIDTLDPGPFPQSREELATSSRPRLMNLADENALEEALCLKDRFRGSTVAAFSVGPESCEKVLRWCLSLGADEAYRLWDAAFEDSDTLATARILAQAVRSVEAEVVFCGSRASDGNTGQVGPQLAELLDIASVTRVTSLDFSAEGDGALAQRWLEGGLRAHIHCPLPALFAIDPGGTRLRYHRLRRRLQGEKTSIPCWGAQELDLRPDEVGLAGSPARVVSIGPPKPEPMPMLAATSGLSAAQRWEMVVSGGVQSRQGNLAEGSPDSLAQQLVDALAKGGFV